MPRPQRPKRDLSQQGGNPTSALQAAYQQLMSIQDPEELAQAALQVVQPLVGSGMSEQNFQKFQQNLQGSARKGLTGVQMFLSNYILKGSGMGVGMEAAESVASFITEDVNDFRDLTPQQQALKTLVESNTSLRVVLL
jgi:hypothetical protein